MASSPRRSVPLALKIATLPPLAMGSPMNEKSQLPCIMITPSSPTHEYDYEFFTFHPEPKQPSFLSTVRQAFTFSTTRSSYISLPESPNPNYTPAQRSTSTWSISKRFRAVLLLAALLFFMLHLCVLPNVDHHGLYDAFTAHSEEHAGDAAAAATMWEVVPDVHGDSIPAAVAVAPAATGLAFDADDTVNGSLL